MRSHAPRFLKSVLASSVTLVALAFSGQALAVQDCKLNGQDVNPNNGNTTAGKTGMMRCVDRDSGAIQREQEIKNGVYMGLTRYYDRAVLTKEYSTNERGNHHGLAREFAKDGKTVIREATYDNGSEVGLVRTWTDEGKPERFTWYDKGEKASAELNDAGKLSRLRCGDKPLLAPGVDDAKFCGFNGSSSKVDLFNARGQIYARVTYLAGKRISVEDLYDSGKPSYKLQITGDQRLEQRFAESGVQLREIVSRITDRSSIKQVEKEFAESGTLKKETRWTTDGDLDVVQTFYLNGQPRSKTAYSGAKDARIAEETSFHDNGQRSSVGRYSHNGRYRETPIGVHQSFNDKGQLVAETTYDDKGGLSRERSWDDSGKLERDEAVFSDGSRKAFSK